MLDQSLAQVMQRLLEKNAVSTPVGVTSRRLQDDLGIGRIQGKTLYLSDRDRIEMRELLRARGYSLHPLPLREMSRSERLLSGTPNEKAGGGALKSGRVSIKVLPGKTLNIAGKTLPLPDACHIDVDWRTIAEDVVHDAIILVENYEVFDQLHLVHLDLPAAFVNPLVLYRGDKNESRQDNVKAFLTAIDLPVMAFVDIDPKGLQIAGTCPHFVGVLAPAAETLELVLGSPAMARADLYRNQIPGVESYLRQVPTDSAIGRLWYLLQKHRSGAVQERWLGAGIPCSLWV